MSRTVIHALLAVILLAATPLRVLCADSCVPDAEVGQPSGHEGPACHEPHSTAPPSHSDPSESGCRHGDDSPARSLRASLKPVDATPASQGVVHVVPDRTVELASMTSRFGAEHPLLRVDPSSRFLTPLRI